MTHEDWRVLYQAATSFYQLAPWRWMYDSDLFGVKNPATADIGYCCIMGNAGEHFALGVYLGATGLAGYRSIQSRETTAQNALLTQLCLMASFEDRKFLEKEDRAIIKKLGLSFHGRFAWPLFRRYDPGYFPWFITKDQAEFLLLALQETMTVARRFKDGLEYLTQVTNPDSILIRAKDEKQAWHDTWVKPPKVSPATPDPIPPDEIDQKLLADLLENTEKSSMMVEIGVFPAQMPVREKKDRPYLPYLYLIVHDESGFVLDVGLDKYDTLMQTLSTKIAQKILQSEFKLPGRIAVNQEEVYQAILPLATKLGIEIMRTKKLPALAKAHQYLEEFPPFPL